MNVDNIKNDALLIAKYSTSIDATQRQRAKDCISQLTSLERKSLIEVIQNTQDPSVTITHAPLLEKKLSTINSHDPIIKEKDAHLNSIQKSMMGVWRKFKNSTGFRKSSTSILKEIDKFAIFSEIKNLQKMAEENLFAIDVSVDDLIQYREELKNTSNYSKEVFIFKDQYKLFGLKPGASLIDVEKKYDQAIKKAKSADEINEIQSAYQTFYTMNMVKNLIGEPQTLEKALKELKNTTHHKRALIAALCHAYAEMPANAAELNASSSNDG